jgi:O-antigen/teichoic acid export membrane protein
MSADTDETEARRRDAAARKRGLKRIAIAIILLLLALVLLLALQPAPGQRYSTIARILIQLVSLVGYGTLLSGLFRTIAGAGVGSIAAVLKAIAVAIVVGGILAGIIAGWLVHALVTEPWSADEHHRHDWD